MRKSQRCSATALQQHGDRLLIRTCLRPRHHPDDHADGHGNWKEPNP